MARQDGVQLFQRSSAGETTQTPAALGKVGGGLPCGGGPRGVGAAVAWYNTFIPGQRLANPIRQEAWHHVLFVFADDATDERLISRSLTQEETEGLSPSPRGGLLPASGAGWVFPLGAVLLSGLYQRERQPRLHCAGVSRRAGRFLLQRGGRQPLL